MDSFIGELRVDRERGVIYFDSHFFCGKTILRIQGLPSMPELSKTVNKQWDISFAPSDETT